jgi:hypothetical protein
LLSNAKTVSHHVITYGCRFKVFAKHNGLSCCNALLPTAPVMSWPFDSALTKSKSSNQSMHSHSGGPLGTHSYRSLLGFACSVGPCYLIVSVTFHVAIVHSDRTPRTRTILTWSLLLIATTTGSSFILGLFQCSGSGTPVLSAAFVSRGLLSTRLDSRGLLIHSFHSLRGLSSPIGLPRTLEIAQYVRFPGIVSRSLLFLGKLFTWSLSIPTTTDY